MKLKSSEVLRRARKDVEEAFKAFQIDRAENKYGNAWEAWLGGWCIAFDHAIALAEACGQEGGGVG